MIARLPDRAGSNALLIGVSQFADSKLDDLPAVANNLAGIEALLAGEADAILDLDRCEKLPNPTTRELGAALARVVDAATDTVIVYFAGHGLLDQHGAFYLATADTDPEQVTYTAVPFEWVRSALARSPARNRVLILDCCFSGHATQSMTSLSSAVTAAIDIAGTYTIASAPATSVAIAPVGAQFTAFTGELLTVLRQGIAGAGELLSLHDIYQALVRGLVSRAMPRPQSLSTGVADLIAIARNRAPQTAPTQRSNGLESALLKEMATFPRRWLRPGYRIDEVQQWVAATAEANLRHGEYWPGPPTVPRFRRHMAGWDPEVVDAFTRRHTPFAPSALFGDGRTMFANELRHLLNADDAFRTADQLTTEQITRLRRQLRLPDAERLVGGVMSGHAAFTEYVYFTDWGLRARNDRGETTMLLRSHNDNAELLSIPYAGLPLARVFTGDHVNVPSGEASVGGVTWYEVNILFDGVVFTVLSASSGQRRSAQVAERLEQVQNLCAQHLQRDAHL